MAIIDRVKKRAETDLDDTELQLLIDEANQDVISKCGPHANSAAPITVWFDGYVHELVPSRPIDVSQTVVITEYITELGWGETSVIVNSNDYRIWPGGYRVQRLQTGNNPRSRWPERVQIVYTPVSDGDQREEVIIKLVILSLEFDTASRRDVGDVKVFSKDYQTERDKIISSLYPRRGLNFA